MTNRSHAACIAAALALLGTAGCIAPADDGSEDVATQGAALESGVTATVTHWDASSRTLTVVNPALSTEFLRHNAGTINGFEDPNEYPPDPCRAIGLRWNMFVFQQRSAEWFRSLLGESARFTCDVRFIRSDVANADGSFDLVEIRPTPAH